MKIYVVSAGHVDRLHTFKLFERLGITDYEVVTDTRAMANAVTSAANPKRVHVTGARGVLSARQYINSKLARENEWFLGVDDNIRVLNVVHARYYAQPSIAQANAPAAPFKSWRQVYRTAITTAWQVECLVDELVQRCEKRGTIYGGFASMENPFFRQKKWSYFRFVKTKFFVMRNRNITWAGGNIAHDSYMSAHIVAAYGSVVVNNFMHPAYKMYEAGGLGTRAERTGLDDELRRICTKYPGLVDIGRGANTALRFIRHSETSVHRWRVEHGYESEQ